MSLIPVLSDQTPTTPAPSKPLVLEPGRAALLACSAVALLALAGWLLLRGGDRDGLALSDVPFPLEPCLVPPHTLAVAARPDTFPVLDAPRLLTLAEADAFRIGHGKFLVPGDRVIGVAVDGDACAFPLRIMEWHEVVNVTLGGRPIAVTFGALSESVRAWDRRVGRDLVDLRPSGVLASMNPLLWDAAAGEASSLWSQIDGRAITGPRAQRGAQLEPVPAVLVPWAAWRAEHPNTRVLAPDLRVGKLYKRNPYAGYMGRDTLPFPVFPLPPPGLAPKARVLAVEVEGSRAVYAVARVAARAAATSGTWETEQAGETLLFEVLHDPAGVQPESLRVTRRDGGPVFTVPALWFAWYASHPQDPLVD